MTATEPIDIERSIISACLSREKSVLDYIIGSVELADFTEPTYREIFGVILDIALDGDLPTRFRIGERLRATSSKAALARMEGINLNAQYQTTAGIRPEIEQLKDAAIRQKLLKVGNFITRTVETDRKPAKELVNGLYNSMLEMLTAGQSGGAMDLSEAITRTQKMQDELKSRDSYRRLKTGLQRLDDLLVITPGKVIILGGYTSHGKSALALTIANNMMLSGIPILYISIEMDYADITYRLASMNGQTVLYDLLRGNAPSVRQVDGIKNIAPFMDNFHLVDLDCTSEVEIVLHMQQHMIRYPDTGMIFIDYLQNVDCERYPKLSRHLQMSAIARYFRSAAKRLKVPTMVLSQLARPEKRDGKFRIASRFDLKESGDIETSADAILLINRIDERCADWYALLDLNKQRQGQTGLIDMHFTGRYVRFEEQNIPENTLQTHGIKRG